MKDPKFSLKMLIFQNNCQFGSMFWIRPDEIDTESGFAGDAPSYNKIDAESGFAGEAH